VEVFAADGVRPLNITNTSNRLIASAVRHAIEPTLASLVTHEQRGFLKDRVMLANLVDVDEGLLRMAATHSSAFGVFFDLLAAFPSVEQLFLHVYFRALGWAPWLCRLVSNLFWRNFCSISISGILCMGFAISRGIRQGCPLSPLLFAVISELLLRRIRRFLPLSLRRAYADDLAVLVHNGATCLPILAVIFGDYALISGLQLSIAKTVLVPLFSYDHLELIAQLAQLVPTWAGVKVDDKAKYLGFWLGPGKGEVSWEAPCAKALSRAITWGRAGLGLNMSLRAYRVYMVSVLLYVAQLERLPSDWSQRETTLVRRLFPGPMWWIKADIFHNTTVLGYKWNLPKLQHLSLAVMHRVYHTADWRNGGLRVAARARQLRHTLQVNPDLDQWQWLLGWQQRGFLFQLESS